MSDRPDAIDQPELVDRRRALSAFGAAGLAVAPASLLAADSASAQEPLTAVDYRMFGAVGDGRNDDGVQIKQAHEYANLHGLPVVNLAGEYWIRETNNIPIRTNVQWGHTIFHLDERFNTKVDHRFLVESAQPPRPIELDPAAKARVVAQLRPGVTIIPELAPWRNSLVIVTDENDRIGYRSGARYGRRKSWAREEIFFVEEHGRIIGDIAWEFSDFTSMVAYPGNDGYLVIDGGTFYLSGDDPLHTESGYSKIGFSISRSRTIVRNQWVGLEPGKSDVAMRQRSGFYNFSNVYDATLENVRLIPWEKDRPGDDRDVPEGTYGIGGKGMLNAVFRNVTAEGSGIHWGVFGTNLNKNFRVEQCVLNRIDVHFHCWNLYIRDCRVGFKGVRVTGGGELFVENTTVQSPTFISFRRDYGAKWDGPIRIRNCRHAPETDRNTELLNFVADDFDYAYPIGPGRSIRVEDLVVDYSGRPDSTGTYRVMRLSDFSRASTGQRSFFPHLVEIRNVLVEGRSQGVRLTEIVDPAGWEVARPGGYDGVRVDANCRLLIEGVQLEDLTEGGFHLVVGQAASVIPSAPSVIPSVSEGSAPSSRAEVRIPRLRTRSAGAPLGMTAGSDSASLYLALYVSRCDGFAGDFGGSVVDATFESCGIVGLVGGAAAPLPGRLAFNGCGFSPVVSTDEQTPYALDTELGTSFTNCVVYAPRVAGMPRPELLDRIDFVQVNRVVRYNHLNTRLGNDVLRWLRETGVKLEPRFVEMLKAHHELEGEVV